MREPMILPVSFGDFILLFVVLMALLPMVRQRLLGAQRFRAIRRLEQARGTRVITLIHRQEAVSLLGIALTRFIDVEDSEQVLRAIRLTPDDRPIDLVVHTPGGLVLAAEQIARALHRHPADVSVLVPHYAMSGGTMLALAADRIVMDANAVLGPVDPQIGEFPAVSILSVVEAKGPGEVEDRTLIMADIARKAQRQVEALVTEVLRDDYAEEKATAIARTLTSGGWTHDYPLTAETVLNLGLPVTTELPAEVYALMDLYPQPPQRRPSVQYIPLPNPPEPRPLPQRPGGGGRS